MHSVTICRYTVLFSHNAHQHSYIADMSADIFHSFKAGNCVSMNENISIYYVEKTSLKFNYLISSASYTYYFINFYGILSNL